MHIQNTFFRALYGSLLLLLAGMISAIAQTTPDPGAMGPYAVTKAQYNLGDLAATLDSFPNQVEVRGSVHYPTGLAGGPYPVVVLLHGRHSTCYNTTIPALTSLAWPCPTGYQSITSYEGYDYHARLMASHGYIVISISCNAINADDQSLTNRGMPARGQLVQYHLNLWNTFNTTGGAPFGTLFVGKLDMQHIGTMGHSRGGEGVIYHALLNRQLGSPYGVKAVITLAPVDFFRKVLNGIPVMNIAPYCDGDVSSLSGVHFYDDARYKDTTDESPKYNMLLMGANHNYFNTVWTPGSYIAGGTDDWGASSSDPHCGAGVAGNKRFDSTHQKAAYNTYASAFFRTYVGGENTFEPILQLDDIVPPASSLMDSTNVFLSYHAGRSDRFDVNRTDTVADELINTAGVSVSQAGLLSAGICGGGFTQPSCGIGSSAHEPHKGTTSIIGLGQMGMRWNDTADWYQNDLPAASQDLTYIHSLQFRAALKYNECTPGQSLNFTVQLIDSAGNTSSQPVHDHSYALFYPPGTTPSLLPRVMFNTISIPVGMFTGIDLAKVRHIKFLFNKSAAGSILISDLALVKDKCGRFNATFGYALPTSGYSVAFTDTLTANTGDTLSWVWHFGDAASGTADTSSAHSPAHLYTGPGTYTACLYLQSKRTNGRICTDTFCTTVTLNPPVAITTQSKQEISINPNPASDVLYITGAEKTDLLKIIDINGWVVLATYLTEPTVTLPLHLASGIYNAVVITKTGYVHKKIVIKR